jgi:uncharacterized protein YfiM (DUF2279 family)
MAKKQLFISILLVLMLPTLCSAQVDKAMHVTAGFGITISVTSLTHRPTLGLLSGIGAGVAKELWDSTQRGHDASARDCLATVAGSGAAYAFWKLAMGRKPPVKIASTNPPATVDAAGTQPNAATASVPGDAHAQTPAGPSPATNVPVVIPGGGD